MKPHFSVFGVPVRIHPSFAFLALLLGYLLFSSPDSEMAYAMIALWIPIVTIAILVHELGHALVGRAFGLAPFVTLHGMGGVTQFDGRAHRALSHGKRVLITLAGPLAGIAVGGGTLAAWVLLSPLPDSVAERALQAGVFTTLGWGIMNLIPMMPLDGGHIVATVLDKLFGIRGVLFARVASIALAVLLVAIVLFYWEALQGPWFTLFILGSLGYSNWRGYQLEKEWQTEAPLQPILKRAFEALEAGRTAEVRELGAVIRDAATTPLTKARAAHLLAWACLLEGDAHEARRALDAGPKDHPHDAFLEGRVLLACERPSEAIRPLIEALVDRADDESAGALALALAGAGRVDELVALLESPERSSRAGRAVLERVARELERHGEQELARVITEKIDARFPVP